MKTAVMPFCRASIFGLGWFVKQSVRYYGLYSGMSSDKVMPREFGKPEPWNFLFKSR